MRALRGALALIAGLGALASQPSAFAAPSQPHVVFMMTNAADKNEVIAFREDANNSTGYESRHYKTGGRGSGGVTDPLGSQGSLVLSTDHTLLFAVNAGSGDISVFRVHNASLELIDTTPSGGSEPVAVAQWGDRLYAVNAGGYGSVAVFKIKAGGVLNQIKDSTVNLNGDLGGGSSIAVRPDGRALVVTERGFNNIDTFAIHSDGTLGPIVVNHSSAPGVFSAIFDPAGVLLVSETGPAGASDASALSSYWVTESGALAAVTQSAPTYGNANCWNAITPDGKRVYVSNSASSTISGFNLSPSGALTPIATTVVGTNPAGSINLDVAISSDGRYLFSLNSGTGTISVFGINANGTLTLLLDPSAFEASTGVNGIATL
jgi:6-phosphogluconolactonase (cycloisomerase 2 family)